MLCTLKSNSVKVLWPCVHHRIWNRGKCQNCGCQENVTCPWPSSSSQYTSAPQLMETQSVLPSKHKECRSGYGDVHGPWNSCQGIPHASISDLILADVWALGMVFFSLIWLTLAWNVPIYSRFDQKEISAVKIHQFSTAQRKTSLTRWKVWSRTCYHVVCLRGGV